MPLIYAHSIEGKSPEDWQTLRDHLSNAAVLAEGFAKKFQSGAWARIAALLHDLGKIAGEFQKKLFKANGLEYEDETSDGSVNHSGAGAAYAEEIFRGPAGRTLAYLIMGHHAGLGVVSSFPPFVTSHNYHLWVRMLFSCLIDADWLITSSRAPHGARGLKREKHPMPHIYRR